MRDIKSPWIFVGYPFFPSIKSLRLFLNFWATLILETFCFEILHDFEFHFEYRKLSKLLRDFATFSTRDFLKQYLFDMSFLEILCSDC